MSDTVFSSFMVEDARQAELMIYPDFNPLMDALTGREASIRQLADTLNLPLDTVHYRVKKLCRLGLVQIVGQRKRAGRAIKIYRAVADAFFLPYSVFSTATLEEKFLRYELQLTRSLVKSYVRLLNDEYFHLGSLGNDIYRDVNGQLREELATGPGQKIDLAAAFPRRCQEGITKNSLDL